MDQPGYKEIKVFKAHQVGLRVRVLRGFKVVKDMAQLEFKV
jgi:hypothetical protein